MTTYVSSGSALSPAPVNKRGGALFTLWLQSVTGATVTSADGHDGGSPTSVPPASKLQQTNYFFNNEGLRERLLRARQSRRRAGSTTGAGGHDRAAPLDRGGGDQKDVSTVTTHRWPLGIFSYIAAELPDAPCICDACSERRNANKKTLAERVDPSSRFAHPGIHVPRCIRHLTAFRRDVVLVGLSIQQVECAFVGLQGMNCQRVRINNTFSSGLNDAAASGWTVKDQRRANTLNFPANVIPYLIIASGPTLLYNVQELQLARSKPSLAPPEAAGCRLESLTDCAELLSRSTDAALGAYDGTDPVGLNIADYTRRRLRVLKIEEEAVGAGMLTSILGVFGAESSADQSQLVSNLETLVVDADPDAARIAAFVGNRRRFPRLSTVALTNGSTDVVRPLLQHSNANTTTTSPPDLLPTNISLRLTHVPSASLGGLLDGAYGISQLDLGHCGLRGKELEVLASAPAAFRLRVTRLDVSGNSLGACVKELAALVRSYMALSFLGVAGCDIGGDGLHMVMCGLKRTGHDEDGSADVGLTELLVGGNRVAGKDVRHIRNVFASRPLTLLNLQGTNMGGAVGSSLVPQQWGKEAPERPRGKAAGKPKGHQKVKAGSNRKATGASNEEAPVEPVAGPSCHLYFGTLRVLSLSNCSLGVDDLRGLCQALVRAQPAASCLRVLCLAYNSFGAAGLQIIAKTILPHFVATSLDVLDLTGVFTAPVGNKEMLAFAVEVFSTLAAASRFGYCGQWAVADPAAPPADGWPEPEDKLPLRGTGRPMARLYLCDNCLSYSTVAGIVDALRHATARMSQGSGHRQQTRHVDPTATEAGEGTEGVSDRGVRGGTLHHASPCVLLDKLLVWHNGTGHFDQPKGVERSSGLVGRYGMPVSLPILVASSITTYNHVFF